MSIIKKLFVLTLIFVLTFTLCANAKVFNLDDCGIVNVTVPDDYMACTLTECDENFQTLLSGNNFTFDTWKNQLMIPSNYALYACQENDPGKCMYVIFEKCEKEEIVTNKDGSRTHKLMDDYNLIDDGDPKDEFLKNLKEALIFQGIAQESINQLCWATPLKETLTPYTEYICNIGSDMVHCYETIYGGNKIKLQFSSKNVFTQTELETHLNILSELTYSNPIDYTEVKNIIHEDTQKKLEEETNSGENTKIIRYIISVSIALVIIFALYMAIKTQKTKRKQTVVLRAHEKIPEDEDDTTDNN